MNYPSNRPNWGVPPWADESAYGDTTQWSENRWRWEFLRRRSDLRSLFDENAQAAFERYQEVYREKDVLLLRSDEPGFCIDLNQEQAKALGFARLPNPRIGEQPAHVLAAFRDCLRFYDALEHDDDVPVPAGWMAAVLDLSAPWQHQAEQIRQHFEFLQNERLGKTVPVPRQHRKNWLRYLRVLDGREAEASLSDLAEIAAAENGDASEKNAHQVWQAAKAIMIKWPT